MKMYLFVSPCCVAFEDRECSRVTLRGKMLSLHACFFRGDLGTLLIMFGSVMSMYRLSILIMLSPFMIDKGSSSGFGHLLQPKGVQKRWSDHLWRCSLFGVYICPRA